jgi:putative membrane protein
MKRTLQGVTLAAVLLSGGVTLAQSAMPSTKPATAKGGMLDYQGFMAPADEKAFLERVHHINQAEIKQARLAQTSSQNPDVKRYADHMIQAHTDADQKLMTYAEGKKLKLADPKPADDVEKKSMAADKADMEKLQALKGAPFDSCYMAGQVAAHDSAIGMVMAAMKGMGATGELATMLNTLNQELPKHRDMAYQTLGKLSGAMGVGGSGDSMQGGAMHHGSSMNPTTPSEPMSPKPSGGATKTK